ncbi:hypothetical protein AB6A40_001170 [Gnathostoma spinigerum]|uniref:Uncharacterized protein n=1 Tax=Gnathostoma spinigerum TaxID=75299 RepID=A0ABD6E5S1_9BILA
MPQSFLAHCSSGRRLELHFVHSTCERLRGLTSTRIKYNERLSLAEEAVSYNDPNDQRRQSNDIHLKCLRSERERDLPQLPCNRAHPTACPRPPEVRKEQSLQTDFRWHSIERITAVNRIVTRSTLCYPSTG